MGKEGLLPDSLLVKGQLYLDEVTSLKRIPLLVKPDSIAAHLRPGEIDSVLLTLNADFNSGVKCPTTVHFLLRTFPSYDTTERDTICEGDTFHWKVDGQDYSYATRSPYVVMHTTEANCDSIVRLDLAVKPSSSHVDRISDCRPVTWINGNTYTQSNTSTAATDTVHLLNQWGCDSLVMLNLSIFPMTTQLEASLDYLDLDHMEVELSDISINGATRTWIFPDEKRATEPSVRYTIPYELDSATIVMIEQSEHGCMDTISITLPFRKNVIYLPNVFTPGDDDSRNTLFGPRSRHLLKMEMLIYNRRGELVHACHEVDCPWDGRDLAGNPCPQGAYVYVVRYTTDYEPYQTQLVKGAVTLIR